MAVIVDALVVGCSPSGAVERWQGNSVVGTVALPVELELRRSGPALSGVDWEGVSPGTLTGSVDDGAVTVTLIASSSCSYVLTGTMTPDRLEGDA
jgi:hypothetical protein